MGRHSTAATAPRDTAKKGGSGIAEAASWPRKDSQVGGFQPHFTLVFFFFYLYIYIDIYCIYIFLFMYLFIYVCVDGWMDGWMDGGIDTSYVTNTS